MGACDPDSLGSLRLEIDEYKKKVAGAGHDLPQDARMINVAAPALLMKPGTRPISAAAITDLITVIRQPAGEHIRHCPQPITELTDLNIPDMTQTEADYQMEQIHHKEHRQDKQDPKNPDHLFPPQFPASA